MHSDNVRCAHRRPTLLIAAPPGRMRDSLCLLLRSMRKVEIAVLADDCATAVDVVARQRPALVLLDGDLPGEGACALLARWAGERCPSRCIVLANSIRQRREALAAGADGALLKGYSTLELLALLDRLEAGRCVRKEGAPHEDEVETPSLTGGRAADAR